MRTHVPLSRRQPTRPFKRSYQVLPFYVSAIPPWHISFTQPKGFIMSNVRNAVVTAVYPMFTDGAAEVIMISFLKRATDGGLIDKFEIVEVKPMNMGVQEIVFKFWREFDIVGTIENSFDDAREVANLIVYDTDCTVENLELL